MDTKLYYAIYAVLLVLQAFFIPIFLKAETPHPCKKSLFFKQLCSTIFLVNAVVAGLIGDFTKYAMFMFIGLCFSWVGDFLLHVSPKPGFFVAGLFSFLIGHIFYFMSYCRAFAVLFPQHPLFTMPEIIIYIALVVCVMAAMFFIFKVHFGKMIFPCCLYAATIAAMGVKAFALAREIISTGVIANSVFTGIMLMLGAVCFIISDFTLSLLTFQKDIEKHGALRQVNIWTYFYAQMFLGVTIFFITA